MVSGRAAFLALSCASRGVMPEAIVTVVLASTAFRNARRDKHIAVLVPILTTGCTGLPNCLLANMRIHCTVKRQLVKMLDILERIERHFA